MGRGVWESVVSQGLELLGMLTTVYGERANGKSSQAKSGESVVRRAYSSWAVQWTINMRRK